MAANVRGEGRENAAKKKRRGSVFAGDVREGRTGKRPKWMSVRRNYWVPIYGVES